MTEKRRQGSDWVDVSETSLSDVAVAADKYRQNKSPANLEELNQAINTAEILGVDTVLVAVQLIKSLPTEVKRRFAQKYNISDSDLKDLLNE